MHNELAAIQAAVAAERERIKAVISLPEAQGRMNSALHIALSGDLELECIRTLLAGLPKQQANAFPGQMRHSGLYGGALEDGVQVQGGLVEFNPVLDAELARPNPRAQVKKRWKKVIGEVNSGEACADIR